ncbi:hypothetical protein BDF14DRAFT_1494959 [Spinellus fusiger]|nr:hypothetical protein BDF14DRAFT_1494959 [Spinellus fusiger]
MLVESVDPSTSQILSIDKRMALFKKYLVHEPVSFVAYQGEHGQTHHHITLQSNKTFALLGKTPVSVGLCTASHTCVAKETSPLATTGLWSLTVQPKEWKNYDYIIIIHRNNNIKQTDMQFISPIEHTGSLMEIALGGVQLETEPVLSIVRFTAIHNPLLAYRLTMTGHALQSVTLRQRVGTHDIQVYHTTLPATMTLVFHQLAKPEPLVLEFWSVASLEATLHVDWYKSAGQWLLRYGVSSLLNFWWATTLCVLYTQWTSRQILPFEKAFLSCCRSTWLYSIVLLGLCGYRTGLQVIVAKVPWFSNPSSVVDRLLLGNQGDFFWWLPVVMWMLGIGLTAVVWAVVSGLLVVLSQLCLHLRLFMHRGTESRVYWIAGGCIFCLPYHVVFCLFYIWHLCKTVHVRVLALQQTSFAQWQTYRYQQSMVLFLTCLLPFHVPGLIVYIKDWCVGWRAPLLLDVSVDSLPVYSILLLILWVDPRVILYHRVYLYALRIYILFTILYGTQIPFPLTFLIH